LNVRPTVTKVIISGTLRLIKEKIVSEKEIENLEKESRKLIEEAVQFAENSPFPEPEEAFKDLFFETDMEGVKENG